MGGGGGFLSFSCARIKIMRSQYKNKNFHSAEKEKKIK